MSSGAKETVASEQTSLKLPTEAVRVLIAATWIDPRGTPLAHLRRVLCKEPVETHKTQKVKIPAATTSYLLWMFLYDSDESAGENS